MFSEAVAFGWAFRTVVPDAGAVITITRGRVVCRGVVAATPVTIVGYLYGALAMLAAVCEGDRCSFERDSCEGEHTGHPEIEWEADTGVSEINRILPNVIMDADAHVQDNPCVTEPFTCRCKNQVGAK